MQDNLMEKEIKSQNMTGFTEGILPKTKNMISGGASLSKEIEEKLNGVSIGYEEDEINDNIYVRQGFGLSENVATGTFSKRGAYKFGSIGVPVPYENISIFKPETDNMIHVHKDGKRWIHTKDIGYMDKNGHVIGFEHPSEQCVPIAFIVADQNCGKSNGEIEKYIKEECYKNLEETSIPYGYVFADELPINLGGKIDGEAIKVASEIDLMKKDNIPKKELFFKR